jgi:hypothetical protein
MQTAIKADDVVLKKQMLQSLKNYVTATKKDLSLAVLEIERIIVSTQFYAHNIDLQKDETIIGLKELRRLLKDARMHLKGAIDRQYATEPLVQTEKKTEADDSLADTLIGVGIGIALSNDSNSDNESISAPESGGGDFGGAGASGDWGGGSDSGSSDSGSSGSD